jgi:hypothetical protein
MCGFRECNPGDPSTCPCRAVARHGGPMTSEQCANVMSEPVSRVRNIETVARAKLRHLYGRAGEMLADLLSDWPRFRASTWEMSDEKSQHLGEMEAQAMNKQITKRWRELGWK